MKQYFIDSNVLIALMDERDVLHKQALHVMTQLENDDVEFFFSDVVINETLSVLAKRCEAKKNEAAFQTLAEEFRKQISNRPILCLYGLLPSHYHNVIDQMIESRGLFNFHDCLIILFLKETKEIGLVTFDQDFHGLKNVQTFPKLNPV